MLASTVDPPVAQQKRQQLLALAAKILRCRRACPDKIADRFMHRVRHPNRRQIGLAVKARPALVEPGGKPPVMRCARPDSLSVIGSSRSSLTGEFLELDRIDQIERSLQRDPL